MEDWKGGDVTDEEFIPQHRILYFRKASDGVKVWDRKRRLDEIFKSGVPGGLPEKVEEGKVGDVEVENAEVEVEDEDDGGVEIDVEDMDAKGQRTEDAYKETQGEKALPTTSRT